MSLEGHQTKHSRWDSVSVADIRKEQRRSMIYLNVALNNVVGFSSGTVEEDINIFLDKLALKSERTKESYTRAIKRFFMWHCNKELSQLALSDLQIANKRMIQYQLHLNNDFDYTNATINQYTSAVISLYEYLSRDKQNNVRAEDVKLDMLPDDGENYGELYWREAETMAELVVKQKKGHEKAALIRLAYRTSFRKSTLLSLCLSDFKYIAEGNCYLVTGMGKGKKKHERPISIELYNDLVTITQLKYYARYNDNRIFHLSDQGIRDMLNALKQEMGINEERNIVFHSFRNAAAGYIAETGGTIEEIRDQLNHSGYGALKHYMHKDKNYSNMAGLKMGEEIDRSLFETMSREQLLELIFNQSEGVVLKMQRHITR